MKKIKKSTKSKTLNYIAFIIDILLILIYLPHILLFFLVTAKLETAAYAICEPSFMHNWFRIALKPFPFMFSEYGFLLFIPFLLWTGINIYVIFTRKGFKAKLIPLIMFVLCIVGFIAAFLCSIQV